MQLWELRKSKHMTGQVLSRVQRKLELCWERKILQLLSKNNLAIFREVKRTRHTTQRSDSSVFTSEMRTYVRRKTCPNESLWEVPETGNKRNVPHGWAGKCILSSREEDTQVIHGAAHHKVRRWDGRPERTMLRSQPPRGAHTVGSHLPAEAENQAAVMRRRGSGDQVITKSHKDPWGGWWHNCMHLLNLIKSTERVYFRLCKLYLYAIQFLIIPALLLRALQWVATVLLAGFSKTWPQTGQAPASLSSLIHHRASPPPPTRPSSLLNTHFPYLCIYPLAQIT